MAFLVICLIIFVGSLLSGLLPFALPVSQRHINVLAAFGGGMLVATALAVITPEGMEAFHEATEESALPHAAAGLALTAGFAAMLAMDHLQGRSAHLKHAAHDSDGDSADGEGAAFLEAPGAAARQRQRQADAAGRAFMGLLVHSLADGVAVGTTGVSDKQRLKLVVAFAMVLHKVPATFGLVAFLLSAGWPRARIRGALAAFAASAPLAALATYGLLVAIPGLSSNAAVALWLLASGGTFLYAACMHVLPHLSESSEAGAEHALTTPQLLAVLGGCAVPILIQFLGHAH